MKTLFLALFLLFLAAIGYGIYRNKHPRLIGVHEGRLSPCPGTPNCVSSQSRDPIFAIDPFPIPKDFKGSPIKLLARIISDIPRTALVEVRGDYLHAEFRSQIFSFTDDVEFLVDREKGVVQVRSASRVGYGDMGVNRKRVEMLRREFIKQAKGE